MSGINKSNLIQAVKVVKLYFAFFQNTSKVTISLTRNLHLCLPNATDCCTTPLCVVETLQVLACRDSVMLAHLLIQAEIYANSSFTGNVSGKCLVVLKKKRHFGWSFLLYMKKFGIWASIRDNEYSLMEFKKSFVHSQNKLQCAWSIYLNSSPFNLIFSFFFFLILLQKMQLSSQTRCFNHWALVLVTWQLELVMFVVAVIRYLFHIKLWLSVFKISRLVLFSRGRERYWMLQTRWG